MTVDNQPFNLMEAAAEKPLVIEFGSFTWPPFRRQVAVGDETFSKYDGKVTFVILYQREAHPNQMDFQDIDQPVTMEERLALASRCKPELGLDRLIVVDKMDNAVREAYGGLPNSVYIVKKGGEIVLKEAWGKADGWPVVLDKLLAEGGGG
jgi:hypothetical protein